MYNTFVSLDRAWRLRGILAICDEGLYDRVSVNDAMLILDAVYRMGRAEVRGRFERRWQRRDGTFWSVRTTGYSSELAAEVYQDGTIKMISPVTLRTPDAVADLSVYLHMIGDQEGWGAPSQETGA